MAPVGCGNRVDDGRSKIGRMGANGDEHDRASRLDLLDSDAEIMDDLLRQVETTRPLSAGEQQRLLGRAGLGDNASVDRLVSANLSMVIRLAAVRGKLGISMPDLVQEGSIGLVEAIRSFAISGESDFVHFAEQHIEAQMDAALAAEAASARDAERLIAAATDYERTQMVLRMELQRSVTDEELAEKLEWTVERTRYVAQVVAEARRRHDVEMLEFIDPAAIDFDDDQPSERGN